jgi:hypothetical protein
MQPERVVIARVSAVIVVVVAAAIRAFGSLLLGHLIPIVKIVIISSGGRPRARATIIGVVATPIVLPLHASDARRPSNGSRDILLLDGVARCNSSGRDTPSATDALDLDG